MNCTSKYQLLNLPKLETSWIFFAGISSLIGLILFPQDWAGWVLFGSCLFLPFLFKNLRQHRLALNLLLFTILIHSVSSIVNVYIAPVPGASNDAVTFDYLARKILAGNTLENFLHYKVFVTSPTQFVDGTAFYAKLLACFYAVCPSKFFGGQTSVFFFVFSCILFWNIFKCLELNTKYFILSLLLFGWTPHVIFWTSITLRESLQLLLLLLATHASLKIHKNQNRIIYSLIACFSMLIFSCTHKGFLYITLIYGVIFFVPLPQNLFSFAYKNRLLLSSTLLIIISTILIKLDHSNLSQHILEYAKLNKLLHYIAHYRQQLLAQSANSNYFVAINFSTISGTLHTFYKIWCYYLFTPLPWQSNGLTLFFVSIFVATRTIVTIAAAIQLFIPNDKYHNFKLKMLIFYGALTFIMSLGTANYGSALRHQILSDWIIFLLGTSTLCIFVDKLKQTLISYYFKKRNYSHLDSETC